MSASTPPDTVPHGLDVLRTYGDGFAGREAELTALDQAWSDGTVRAFVLHAEGGAGKTRVVARWLTSLRDAGWRGAGRVFVHSFYDQGSDEKRNASSELFFEQALLHFGHTGPRLTDPTEQGRTLARLIVEQRGLLVLDGLEPLQHPPSFDQGRLKDPAIYSLLRFLAAGRINHPSGPEQGGLCVVTSRQPVVELQDRLGRAVVQQPLDRLDAAAGAELLRQLEVRGPELELRQAVEDSRGHAYSLMLLGTYLRDATADHEIRRRREILLLAEDAEHRYHARHLFGAYVQHLGESSPEVAVLRLLGFFDRPAEEELLAVLREATEPELAALTAPIQNLPPAGWRRVLRRLTVLRLIDVPVSHSPLIDSHPLLREYFAEQLRAHFPEVWRVGHRRLFEHLCETTDHQPSTLTGLQPLYQAVAHGCLAGSPQAAYAVYNTRIHRGSAFFPIKQLGAIGMDSGCVSNFFEQPWKKLRSELSTKASAAVFDAAAEGLHSLLRLAEAREAMIAYQEFATKANRPKKVTEALILLSELSISAGDLVSARNHASEALAYSKKHADLFHEEISCAALAVAERERGDLAAAGKWFERAQGIRSKRSQGVDFLTSIQGYEYCEFLYALALRSKVQGEKQKILEELEQCAKQCLAYGERTHNQLALGLAKLANSLASGPASQERIDFADSAVTTLRKASDLRFLPRALTLRSLALFETGMIAEAAEDLDSARDIAERGPMPLLLVDVYLARAHVLHDRAALEEAEKLIYKHGYHRRNEELAGALEAAERWNNKESLMPAKVFVSYSHDSEQHSQRVLALANQLRKQGIDAELDQYETRPPQGWPRWCEEQLRPENSEHVLVICTEMYVNRIEGKVPADEGRGVFWEGSVIYSYLYDQKSNERFIPILFDHKDVKYIPRPLNGTTRYSIATFDLSDTGYSALYRELTHQPAVEKPPLGDIVDLRRGFDVRGGEEDDIKVLPPVAPRKARSTFSATELPPAVAIWLKKLDLLLVEEAKAFDPAAKFKIQQDIEEAREKIRELGGQA
jgi:hypothetical protein